MCIESGSRKFHRFGFVLPLTLILIAFTTITLTVVGVMVSRSTRQLQGFSIVSEVQRCAANVVEVATSLILPGSGDYNAAWSDGLNEFIEFVRYRGGLEGQYWEDSLSSLDDESNWRLVGKENAFTDFISKNPGFDGFSTDAVVYKHSNSRYLVIGSAEKGGVKRYSFGLALAYRTDGRPTFVFGDVNREFVELKTVGEESTLGGDLFRGDAIIYSIVEIDDESDANMIFRDGLMAYGLDYSNPFTKFTGLSEDQTIRDYLDGLLSVQEARNESLSVLRPGVFNNQNTWTLPTLPDFSENYVLVIDDHVLPENTEVTIAFDNHPQKDPVEITWPEGNKTMKVVIPRRDHVVNIRIDADVRIGEHNDTHKINYIDGQYDFTVYGNLKIHSNLVYNDFDGILDRQYIFGKDIPLAEIEDKIKELIEQPNRSDHLEFTVIGGDVNLTYGTGQQGQGNSSHGVRALNGDFSAIPLNDEGGDFVFPDLGTVTTGRTIPQMMVFGSLTGVNFGNKELGPEDHMAYLEQLVMVSDSPLTEDDMENVKLALVGLRVW